MSEEVVHRLGMAVAGIGGVLCAIAVARGVWSRRAVRKRASVVLCGSRSRCGDGRDGGTRRLWHRITRAAHRDARRPDAERRDAERSGGGGVGRLVRGLQEWVGPLGACGFVVILVDGAPGLLMGLAVGFGARAWIVRQRGGEGPRLAKARVEEDLAPVGDLLAACLAAGAGPRESAEAVGRSLDGPVAARLRHVAAELKLGGEPATVWGRLADLPGAEALARSMERAGISGVPAVEAVSRIAAELRAERGRAAARRARRAGVLVTLPLSACSSRRF